MRGASRQECRQTAWQEKAPKGKTPWTLSARNKADKAGKGANRREGSQTLRTKGGGNAKPA